MNCAEKDLLIIHRMSHIQKTSQTYSGPTTNVIVKVACKFIKEIEEY